jgi:glycosyltransferase involved in cell wall biosynthesis
MEREIKAVWLNEPGFPYSMSAPVQKLKLIGRALTANNVRLTVVCRRAVHRRKTEVPMHACGEYEGVDFIFTPGTPYRPEGFLRRNVLKLWGHYNELRYLYRRSRNKDIDIAILHTRVFLMAVFYRMVLKLTRIPVIMPATEYSPGNPARKKIVKRVNDWLFNRYGYRLVDGVMPISEFLMDEVRKNAPRTPLEKVPVLSDFSRFQGLSRNGVESYFLYCGHLDYFEVVEFCLRAFDAIPSCRTASLYLVVNGRQGQLEQLKARVVGLGKGDCVKIYSGVSDEELSKLYFNAAGLLIPLRPTLQDRARFPHKIGEYLASGNPVITTNVGEVSHYFIDTDDALVAEHYDVDEFAGKMEFVLEHPDEARRIGENGRRLGLRYFNYKVYGPRLKRFILKTISRY